ncbi:MAG: PAN/Apple domain-containing protein, partial [Cypionkella sp.]
MIILATLCAASLPSLAPAQELIPQKRFAMYQDTDFAGGDIASIFDTSLEACQRACIANSACEAFTFNTKNGSCFTKAGGFEQTPFAAAQSGIVLQVGAGANARAMLRRTDLNFMPEWEFSTATDQARGLGNVHFSGGTSAEDYTSAARDSEANGDIIAALSYRGAATTLTDAAGDWAEYARLLAAGADYAGDEQRAFLDRSLSADINAYLRADAPALQHTVLAHMAQTLERLDRGRDMVKALRLAQSVQTRNDTALAL